MGMENSFGSGRVKNEDKAEDMARASNASHSAASYETGRGNPLYAHSHEETANKEEELAGVIHDLQRLLESNKINNLPTEKLQILKYVAKTLLE